MNNGTPPTRTGVEDVVQVLRILADTTRMRVLSLLRDGELNVSGLCDRLELAQPTVSHHLGLLRSIGLIKSRRDGKQIFYTLSPDSVNNLEDVMKLEINSGPVRLTVGPIRPADQPQMSAAVN